MRRIARVAYSRAGFVSFFLSLVTATAFGAALIVVDQFHRQQIRTGYEGGVDAPIIAIVLGVVSLIALIANFAAFGLGAIGIFQNGYGKLFAILGLAASLGVLLLGYHQEIICLPPMCLPNDPYPEVQLINYPDFLSRRFLDALFSTAL